MRIHLGHHFYGAGNLGDDFMLAGFLRTMARLAPDASFSSCVPFPLPPLRRRFPQIDWFEYTVDARTSCIRAADVWLGLGGSPFQCAQSRWFVDHLAGDTELCREAGRPMFYLGVGVQRDEELRQPDVLRVCAAARAIWSRDAASADRLSIAVPHARVHAAADVSHLLFSNERPPAAVNGRLGVVANCDYAEWPQLGTLVAALDSLRPTERLWIAQEFRELPGAERALFHTLPDRIRAAWQLRPADAAQNSISDVVSTWPTPEWLMTSRYHAAIASAWGGAKIVVVGINEKLRAVAADLDAPLVPPSAAADELRAAFAVTRPVATETLATLAAAADKACSEFVAAARQP